MLFEYPQFRFKSGYDSHSHLLKNSRRTTIYVSHFPGIILVVLALLTFSSLFSGCEGNFAPAAASAPLIDETQRESDIDKELQLAAESAIGENEGTIIVSDPQTGRIRVILNKRLAIEQPFPVGSAIKPFTALVALRSGIVNRETTTYCKTFYNGDDGRFTCSHPKIDKPLNLKDALAYSCNFSFANLSERISESAFVSTLSSFGFGQKTGINSAQEVPGRIPNGMWRSTTPLGDDDSLLATPIQVLTAYQALANGGRLFQPQIGTAPDFSPSQIRKINIRREDRATILSGMRGAIEYGSAVESGLSSLPIEIFGKTGTSTSSSGFRTQGWFVGFSTQEKHGGDAAPESADLAVLVFLKRGRGKDCARISRGVFATYAKLRAQSVSNPEANVIANNADENIEKLTIGKTPHQRLKVRLEFERRIVDLDIEDYVRGVVTAESDFENQIEALKAQAIASRTFAVRNTARHAAEGFDFCSTTHCQRYLTKFDVRASETSKRGRLIARAVEATNGLVLRSEDGRPIEALFHASCGGKTADANSLWGINDAKYLRSVSDDWCGQNRSRKWSDSISSIDLTRALNADSRTRIGTDLREIRVLKTDSSERAEVVQIEGVETKTIGGWDFKIIVGRTLGWDVLKSSRFQVRRDGSNFIFDGSGFGHGLGFCQEGAHALALAGSSYTQILAHYFPLETSENNVVTNAVSGLLENASASSEIIRSEHFVVKIPAGARKVEYKDAMAILESAHSELSGKLSAASVSLEGNGAIELRFFASTPEFSSQTGKPWWVAAVNSENRISLQPISVLRRKNILETTLKHELAHAILNSNGGANAPRWLNEGLALYFAKEKSGLPNLSNLREPPIIELERRLAQPRSSQELKLALAFALKKVESIIRAEGEAHAWEICAGR